MGFAALSAGLFIRIGDLPGCLSNRQAVEAPGVGGRVVDSFRPAPGTDGLELREDSLDRRLSGDMGPEGDAPADELSICVGEVDSYRIGVTPSGRVTIGARNITSPITLGKETPIYIHNVIDYVMPEPGETKLELLARLANGPRSYTELRGKLKITDPALQRHLNGLQAQGIIGKAGDGRWSLKLEGGAPGAAATLPVEGAEAADLSLYAPSARLRWFAWQDLNSLVSPGAVGVAKFAAATLLTLDVYPVVKMAKELKARFTKGKESGDEYLYASWLQRLIVDSVSFDGGFLAAVKKRGVAAQREQLASVWSITEGLVSADLGFDYGKAYEADRRFAEGKRFRERILGRWTFENELKEAGYRGELTADQFLRLWGWTRIKVYALGERQARRVWKELLLAGLKGMPAPGRG